jgi:hypothetical protein
MGSTVVNRSVMRAAIWNIPEGEKRKEREEAGDEGEGERQE